MHKRALGLSLLLLASGCAEDARGYGQHGLIQLLNGSPTASSQTISVSTTSATQAIALTPGSVVQVQNIGATDIICKPVGSASATVSSSSASDAGADYGVLIEVKKAEIWTLAKNETHVACVTASSTSTAIVKEFR